MTTKSHRLARLIGPALFTISLTESFNAHIWATSSAPTIFLNGSVIFVSGLAIVQNHNVWCRSWPVLVTLAGWGGVALGLMRMLIPERILESVKRAEARDVRIAATVVAAFGAVLSLFGYFGP
ncbi:uncharacterized protein A1O5_06324 [Cladophialophora psammophila CBS 110553]|uniref:Uncharacterized protein n=1 Tax=Cladophialophora psammophila CBS 110553 TaxID=1182543 RepID=W9X005_9EURO|nr:uncharacterized protein A1O5_06324 [Cladophialophora psammophila CBS 110553]EXJ70256.1 hypothetical protein A1O5_06324 [Cladophialophora psammophila CBS 110553]